MAIGQPLYAVRHRLTMNFATENHRLLVATTRVAAESARVHARHGEDPDDLEVVGYTPNTGTPVRAMDLDPPLWLVEGGSTREDDIAFVVPAATADAAINRVAQLYGYRRLDIPPTPGHYAQGVTVLTRSDDATPESVVAHIHQTGAIPSRDYEVWATLLELEKNLRG